MTYPGPQDPQQPSWQQPVPPQFPPSQPGQAYPPFEPGQSMYAGGLQPGFGAGPPPRKRRKLPIVLGVIGGVFVLCLGGTVVAAAASSDDSTGTAAAASSDASTPTKPATTKPATTKPATTKPATTKPAVAATTKPTQKPAAAKPVVTTKPATRPPAQTGYKAVTAHEWKLIVKDPAAHAGEKIIIYGAVFQFDPDTGNDMFLATAGPTKYTDPSDSPAEFAGDTAMLSDLAENDTFRAQAVVVGPDSYDTQDGGNTTVPKLQITSIKTL